MDTNILEQLLTKLIGLTEFGGLPWHFAGEVSKAYVTIYKDARLKLTDQALDITTANADTVRVEVSAQPEAVQSLLNSLLLAAQDASRRFRTGQMQSVSVSSLISTCQHLLSDEQPAIMANCLVCDYQFDPTVETEFLVSTGEKSHFICQQCVQSLGQSAAQERLDQASVLASNNDTVQQAKVDTINENTN